MSERVIPFYARRQPRPESQYEPFDAIREGDVIRWNGRLRTVRGVTRTPDDFVYSVRFAKLRRSGFPSPATVYWRSDVRQAFGGIVAHRSGPLCATDLECRVQAEIGHGKGGILSTVTEDESVGVIW